MQCTSCLTETEGSTHCDFHGGLICHDCLADENIAETGWNVCIICLDKVRDKLEELMTELNPKNGVKP